MKIFIDLDGVLADWLTPAIRLLDGDVEGVLSKWEKLNPRPWDLFDVLDVPRNYGYRKIELAGDQFWARLPIFPHAKHLVKRCQEIGESTILTSPFNHAGSYAGKVKWLDYHFGKGFARKHALIGAKKHVVSQPGSLLIDDRPKNCEAWKREGGTAILFPAFGNELFMYRKWALKYIESQLQAFEGKSPGDSQFIVGGP